MNEVIIQTLKNSIATLPEQEKEVITMLYGLDTGEKQEVEDVAKALGLTVDAVEKLNASALRNLRDVK